MVLGFLGLLLRGPSGHDVTLPWDLVPPIVTVIVPCKNEEIDIARCLEGIGRQRYPGERLEVLVVDGASTDRTAALARDALNRLPVCRGEVISNPVGSTPSNLNIGLAHARGSIICRVDARSLIPADYVLRTVEVLQSRPEVTVVGGAQVAIAPSVGPVGEGIARGLNNRWVMGLSRYRRGAGSGPADTVYLGVFRAEDLRTVDGWDERLLTNQDFDLNRRLSRFGTVWFEAGLEVGYVPRGTVGEVFRQYQRFGRWKVRYWRTTGDVPRPRQLAALSALPCGAMASVLAVAGVRKRRTTSTRVAVAALASAHLVEVTGSSCPCTGFAGRTVAIATLTAVACGCSSGVWAELLRPNR